MSVSDDLWADCHARHDSAFYRPQRSERADLAVVAVWAGLLAFVVLFWALVIQSLWSIDFVAPTTLDTTRHGGIEATMAWAEDRQ